MKATHLSLLTTFLRSILFIGAIWYMLIYLWLVYYRIQYPFELEWTEGGILQEVIHINDGQMLYNQPSIEFTPFLYPPLYFYTSALVAKITGVNFFSLRLVSVISSFVSFFAIFLIVKHETQNLEIAFLAMGLFASTFSITGAWLDVARVDTLFLACLLLFIYFIQCKNSWLSFAVAGLFMALALLTKQTALLTCLPVTIYYLYQDWKRTLLLLIITGSIFGSVTTYFNYMSNGWYHYYTVELLKQQTDWLPLMFILFWTELSYDLPIALLSTILFLGIYYYKKEHTRFLTWLLILLGALGTSFMSRIKHGGYTNVLLPFYTILVILSALGFNETIKLISSLGNHHKTRGKIMLYLFFILQMVIVFYNPIAQIPTQADLLSGYKLVAFLKATPGEVYLPAHPYLSTLANKKSYIHHLAIWEKLTGDIQTEGKTIVTTELNQAIRQQRFAMIILDDSSHYFPELETYYTSIDYPLFENDTVFFPVTGVRKRPTFIYIPKSPKP